MKRQSWNDKQLDRLKAELANKGNTKEAWMELCDLNDLPAMQAGELAAQCGMRLEAEEDKAMGQPHRGHTERTASARKFIPLKKNA